MFENATFSQICLCAEVRPGRFNTTASVSRPEDLNLETSSNPENRRFGRSIHRGFGGNFRIKNIQKWRYWLPASDHFEVIEKLEKKKRKVPVEFFGVCMSCSSCEPNTFVYKQQNQTLKELTLCQTNFSSKPLEQIQGQFSNARVFWHKNKVNEILHISVYQIKISLEVQVAK